MSFLAVRSLTEVLVSLGTNILVLVLAVLLAIAAVVYWLRELFFFLKFFYLRFFITGKNSAKNKSEIKALLHSGEKLRGDSRGDKDFSDYVWRFFVWLFLTAIFMHLLGELR